MEPVDERLKKELSASRRSRESQDRAVSENREVSESDRLEMFRQQLFNDALPDLPQIPGYHVCWLTTTNPRDSIHRRMQLGYEPIKGHEIPGMEYATLKTGEWAGMVGINEMIAFKLPLSLYYKFMKEAHHDAPLREEASLTARADALKEQAERDNSRISEGDGFTDLRRYQPAPESFGV